MSGRTGLNGDVEGNNEEYILAACSRVTNAQQNVSSATEGGTQIK